MSLYSLTVILIKRSLRRMSLIHSLFIWMRWLSAWVIHVSSALFQQKTSTMQGTSTINSMFSVQFCLQSLQELLSTRAKSQIGMFDGKSFRRASTIVQNKKETKKIKNLFQLLGIMKLIIICGTVLLTSQNTMISILE